MLTCKLIGKDLGRSQRLRLITNCKFVKEFNEMSLLKEIMWLFEIYCIKKGFEKCKVYKVNGI